MASMSSWPSQSMEIVMSQRSMASISPARTAFWCPRFRLWAIPWKCSSCRESSVMISQVRSFDPSLTKSTRLSSAIFPLSVSCRSFSRNIPLVTGSTASSL